MKRLLAATAAAFLIAAPITVAQTTGTQNYPPSTTQQQPAPTNPTPTDPSTTSPGTTPGQTTPGTMPPDTSTPTPTPTDPATGNPTTPPTPMPPRQGDRAATSAPMTNASAEVPSCRTRRDEGEQCSCLKAPTDFGTARPAENASHNMCMVPQI